MAEGTVLSKRDLNRALLARQLLLRREPVSSVKAVEKLMGLQAQLARPPFVGLWTRLANFQRSELLQALRKKKLVRVTMWRATLHILSAADYLRFRGSVQPMLTAGMQSVMKAWKKEIDVVGVIEEARRCLAGRPQIFEDIRAALVEKFPEGHNRVMGYAARTQVPLVMIPEVDEFGFGPNAKFGLAEEWLKSAVPTEERLEELVLRYLQGFGPATPMDAQTWSGLPRLKPVFEALRPRLAVFKDEAGRELFDIPDAPRPGKNEGAPVRFLPGFDNIILGHKHRSRIIADEFRAAVTTKNLQVLPTFLVDGFVAGKWDYAPRKGVGALKLTQFIKLNGRLKAEVEAEGERLVSFLGGEDIRPEIVFA